MKSFGQKPISKPAARARAASPHSKRSAVLGLISLLSFVLGLVLFGLGQRVPEREEAIPPRMVEAAALAASVTPAPSAEPTPTPEAETVRLAAWVAGPDVELCVLSQRGAPISGTAFSLLIAGPDGQTLRATTDLEGRGYGRGLQAGEYRVMLAGPDGYAPAQPLRFTIWDRQSFEPLVASRAPVEVKAVEELPQEEVRQAPVEQTTAVQIETIDTSSLPAPEATSAVEPEPAPESEPEPPQAEQDDGEVVVIGEDVPPETEEPAPEPETIEIYPESYYEYSYELGPNGCLLLADGTESEVYPVEENGVLVGGRRVRTVITRVDEDGNRTEVEAIPEEIEEGVYYESGKIEEAVPVLNDDGSALPEYQITATLVTPEPITVEIEPTPAPTPKPAPAPTPEPEGNSVVVVGVKTGWQEEDDGVCFYDASGKRVTGLKEIDGKLCYFNDAGVKARAVGIDVSYFNGAIDWNAVKAHGVDFVIVRLAGRTWGGGVLFEDEYSYRFVNGAGRYLQEARAAGLQIGAYVWSSAINTDEAVEEANLALRILGGMSLDLPLYIDMEYSGNYPNGRADRLTVQQRSEIVQAFCSTVSGGGYRPGVYAGQNYWKAALSYGACSGYSIWMASYTAGQRMPTDFPWPYNVWQCSSSAYVRGVYGACDLNIIF